MTVARVRPDLVAHTYAIRASFPEVADELRKLLGARLVAYLGSVQETRARPPMGGCDAHAERGDSAAPAVALQVALTITSADSARIAQAWFQGLNPQLEDRAPARLLRDGELHEIGPAVIAAARAFLIGG